MRKNLVIIVADTLRHPNLSPSDSLFTHMPFLGEAVQKAVRFDRVVASSNWTLPSHVSLLSGANPWEVSLSPVGGFYKVPAAPGIADYWAGAGGGTVMFSANPTVSPSNGTALGYEDSFPRGLTRGARWLTERLELVNERLLERQTGSDIRPRAGTNQGLLAHSFEFTGCGLSRMFQTYTDGRIVLRDMNRFFRSGRIHRPAHVLVNLMEVHEPYIPETGPGTPPSGKGFFPSSNLSNFHTLLNSRPRSELNLVAAYERAATRLDARLQELFGLLMKWDLWRDSTVLLLSDHGQCLGEHGFFGHGHELYDELILIPAFLWDPGLSGDTGTFQRVPDWIDHRHLRDLAIATAKGDDGFRPESVLEESLARRGPATCYWEGRYSRGTPFSQGTGPTRRAIRILRGEESTWAWLDVVEGSGAGEIQFAAKTSDSGLAEMASVILRGKRAPGEQDSEVAAEVDARLKSWGYG